MGLRSKDMNMPKEDMALRQFSLMLSLILDLNITKSTIRKLPKNLYTGVG